MRETAKTSLELEVVAALEKSIERSRIAVRMLINALTEVVKAPPSHIIAKRRTVEWGRDATCQMGALPV